LPIKPVRGFFVYRDILFNLQLGGRGKMEAGSNRLSFLQAGWRIKDF
jgi:hypothetical protein